MQWKYVQLLKISRHNLNNKHFHTYVDRPILTQRRQQTIKDRNNSNGGRVMSSVKYDVKFDSHTELKCKIVGMCLSFIAAIGVLYLLDSAPEIRRKSVANLESWHFLGRQILDLPNLVLCQVYSWTNTSWIVDLGLTFPGPLFPGNCKRKEKVEARVS